MPKFVLGFLVFSIAACAHAFTAPQLTALTNASRWAFLLTFAGVGLRTNFGEMKEQGLRPFIMGGVAELGIAVATLGLVPFVDKTIGLH